MVRTILALLISLATLGPAFADDDRRIASEHARRGVALYELGRYQGALGEFERAYLLYPTDTLLFNLAQTHRRLDHCRDALDLYRRLLDRNPTSARAPEVRRLLPTLEKACLVKDQDPRGVQPQDGEPPPVVIAPPERTAAIAPAPAEPAADAESATPAAIAATAEPAAVRALPARLAYAAATAGVTAGASGTVTPVGAVAGAAWRVERVRAELGFAVTGGWYAWAGRGHRGASSVYGAAITGGRGARLASLDVRVDVGAGVAVISGIGTGHPLLAVGRRLPDGSTTVPQLDVLASAARGLGGGWTLVGGVRVGAGYGGDALGGAVVSGTALVGLGYRP